MVCVSWLASPHTSLSKINCGRQGPRPKPAAKRNARLSFAHLRRLLLNSEAHRCGQGVLGRLVFLVVRRPANIPKQPPSGSLRKADRHRAHTRRGQDLGRRRGYQGAWGSSSRSFSEWHYSRLVLLALGGVGSGWWAVGGGLLLPTALVICPQSSLMASHCFVRGSPELRGESAWSLCYIRSRNR